MYCPNCGNANNENSGVCSVCGAPANNPTSNPAYNPASNPAYNPTSNPAYNQASNPAYNPASNPAYNQASNPAYNPVSNPTTMQAANWKYSFFDGGLWGLFGVRLLSAFVSLITLGFAWPAMFCFRKRWIYRHTVIGGYRLKFNGTGIQLFGKYILWTLLTIITIGIYGLWLPIKYQKWETKHVEIESMLVLNYNNR